MITKRTRKERLRKLADAIEKDGEHFDMNSWVKATPSWLNYKRESKAKSEVRDKVYEAVAGMEAYSAGSSISQGMKVVREFGDDGKPHCGTELCMAGYAAFLFPRALKKAEEDGLDFWDDIGRDILGLDEGEEWLFNSYEWPREYRDGYQRAKGKKQRAKVGARLLRDLADGKDVWEGDEKRRPGVEVDPWDYEEEEHWYDEDDDYGY